MTDPEGSGSDSTGDGPENAESFADFLKDVDVYEPRKREASVEMIGRPLRSETPGAFFLAVSDPSTGGSQIFELPIDGVESFEVLFEDSDKRNTVRLRLARTAVVRAVLEGAPSIPKPFDPKPFDPKQFDPKQFDPKQVDPKQFDPKQFDPKQFDPKQVDPKQFDPKQFDPKQVDPKQVDPKQVDPKQVDPKQFDPKQFDPKQVDPKQFDPKAIDPKSADPKFSDPGPGPFVLVTPWNWGQ